MKKVLLTCAAAGLLASSAAFGAAVCAPCASHTMFNPWYVGVGLNHYAGMKEEYTAVGTTTGQEKLDKTKIGWNIFAGYNVNCRFGAELGYTYLGKNTWNVNVGATTPTNREEIKGWLGYMDGIYYVPLYKCFKLFAKGGVDYMQLKSDRYVLPAWTRNNTVKLNTFGMNFGFGAQFDWNQFAARLTYTDYQAVTFGQKLAVATPQTLTAATLNGSIPNLLSLDVLYHFG